MTTAGGHPYSVALNIDAPPSSDYVLELAEAFAQIAALFNHQTRHHEALEYPAQADQLIRDVTLAVSRLPQLLTQAGRWLEAERDAGRIDVAAGDFKGRSGAAVAAARIRLDIAALKAEELQEALDYALKVTRDLASDGDDGETGRGRDDRGRLVD